VAFHFCKDGEKSNNETWWAYDGRGIPLCKVCEDCEGEKLSKYRPEVLGHYTEADVDEAIESEDNGYYDYSDVYDF
jgi:hypothetical protein